MTRARAPFSVPGPPPQIRLPLLSRAPSSSQERLLLASQQKPQLTRRRRSSRLLVDEHPGPTSHPQTLSTGCMFSFFGHQASRPSQFLKIKPFLGTVLSCRHTQCHTTDAGILETLRAWVSTVSGGRTGREPRSRLKGPLGISLSLSFLKLNSKYGETHLHSRETKKQKRK